jgi:hypothetical protein
VAWAEPRWCSIGGRADPTTMIAGWNCDTILFRRPTEGDRNFDALPHLARAHFQTNDASSMRIGTASHFSYLLNSLLVLDFKMAPRVSKNGRGWDSHRLLALNLILDLDA